MRYLIICLLALNVLSCGSEQEESAPEVIEAPVEAVQYELRNGNYQVTFTDDLHTETWSVFYDDVQFWLDGVKFVVPLNGLAAPYELSTTITATDIFIGTLWKDGEASSLSIEGCYID